MPDVPTTEGFEAAFRTPIPMVSNPPDYASLHALRTALCANAAITPSSLGGGRHGHMGIVVSPTVYATHAPGTPYHAPPNPGRTAVIPAGATAFVIGAIERAHKAETQDWQEHSNLHNALKNALCKAVHPQYLYRLQHPLIGHANSSVQEMFTHLFDTYAKMDYQAMSKNRQRLHEPWDKTSSLEALGMKFEAIQAMAAESAQPIPAAVLIAEYYTQVYASGEYDDECKTWLAKPDADKTWANLVNHFLDAQAELHRRRDRSTSSAGYHANAATFTPDDLHEMFLATAQSHQALAARQQDDAHELRSQIMALQTQLAAALQQQPARPAPTSQPQQPRPPRIRNTNYCWTHGWRVGDAHTSATCEHRAAGHQVAATRANTMGGSTANQPTAPTTAPPTST